MASYQFPIDPLDMDNNSPNDLADNSRQMRGFLIDFIIDITGNGIKGLIGPVSQYDIDNASNIIVDIDYNIVGLLGRINTQQFLVIDPSSPNTYYIAGNLGETMTTNAWVTMKLMDQKPDLNNSLQIRK